MDVGSNRKYPAGSLSNFTAREFIFDGVECNSMEGLLQAFKFENINSQQITCGLVGFYAKKKGSKRNREWQRRQTLWWNSVEYDRKGKEYQYLLDRAFSAMYDQSSAFQDALRAAGHKTIFTHSIGKRNKKETVLTESEFCSRLQKLKDERIVW